jgi:hypothetical protein
MKEPCSSNGLFIFQNACEKVANKDNKRSNSSYRTNPFNPDVFSDEDFLPSDLSNQPHGK